MSKRHRDSIFALVALIVLGVVAWQLDHFYQAAEQQRTTYNYQPASKPGFRIRASSKSPTEHYKPSCNNPNEREDSDLCAQWAAVDQITESNRLSSLNMRLVILTLAATILGTLALIWTLLETRHIARRQLRAYVMLKCADLFKCVDRQWPAERDHPEQRYVEIDVHNYGATPAHNCVAVFGVKVAPFPLPAPLEAIPDDVERATADLPPNRHTMMPLEVTQSGKLHERLMDGSHAIYCWGEVKYEDIFGAKHTTKISLFSQGASYKRGAFQTTKTGNDSD